MQQETNSNQTQQAPLPQEEMQEPSASPTEGALLQEEQEEAQRLAAATPTTQPQEESNLEHQEEPPQAGSDQWYSADREAFDKAYPDVDKEALFQDDAFLDYAEGKVGVLPLSAIYQGYLRLLDKVQTDKRVLAARNASPGSLRQTALDAEGEYFTLKQMQRMSQSYIEANWDKVQRSLQHLSKQA